MRSSHRLRAGLLAMIGALSASVATAAYADNGTIRISVFKGGWVLGASAGSGTLTFHGKRYPLSIGGLSAGFVFGMSHTNFSGTVTNISRPSDVDGVYGAAGAGVAVVGGFRVISLTNGKGAHLSLTGAQLGLMVNADLSGMAISLR